MVEDKKQKSHDKKIDGKIKEIKDELLTDADKATELIEKYFGREALELAENQQKELQKSQQGKDDPFYPGI